MTAKTSTSDLYVQYGCGFSAPDKWVNFDASYALIWEKLPLLGRLYTKNSQRFPENVRHGNIVKGLPIGTNSCKGVYASHVLEHLALDEFHQALENTKRILRKGGIFRLVVPDLESLARAYISGLSQGNANAAEEFLKSCHLGRPTSRHGFVGLLRRLFNRSDHLWMWDHPSLIAVLSQHGFSNIRRCRFGDCEDPMFSLVEEPGRFTGAAAIESCA